MAEVRFSEGFDHVPVRLRYHFSTHLDSINLLLVDKPATHLHLGLSARFWRGVKNCFPHVTLHLITLDLPFITALQKESFQVMLLMGHWASDKQASDAAFGSPIDTKQAPAYELPEALDSKKYSSTDARRWDLACATVDCLDSR